jgi:Sigma-70 region 2
MDLLPPSEYGTESIRRSSSAGPLMRQSREVEYTEYVQARLPLLRRIAYRLTQDWQLPDDLTQVAITSLYTHWNRARNASSTDAYARRILVRAFIAECRSPWTRRVQLDGGYPELATATPDHDGRLDVRAALAALPPRQRATGAEPLPGSYQLGGAFGVYARLHLLGLNPANWTADPLGSQSKSSATFLGSL